ncbi:uncharacterized protein At4g26485-like [Neltuma alba]|uniref:uncharacterized protein At4g26485-like n=1 Tax=Neltuma alba TaxID=207710 RepID=UPI0010A33E13|nr:uncharacterized protein At4g26485-like [Prosopis alba]
MGGDEKKEVGMGMESGSEEGNWGAGIEWWQRLGKRKKTTHPYSEWDLETLGSSTGLYLKDEVPLWVSDYEGYSVKSGDGRKKFNVKDCSTFIFIKGSSSEALALKVESLTREVSELRAMAASASRVRMEEKTIKHYSSKHKILLVGEGDFSFSLCLAKAFGSASNMVATSLDSKDTLTRNYSRALQNLLQLENLGCTILHEVNAHTMSQHPFLQHKLFDRIVFNFPHAGFVFREHHSFQIESHKRVVRGFLKSSREMVSEDGEIHVTHKTAYPFCEWRIEKIAEEVGLQPVKEVPFCICEYEGYCNKKGSGDRCDDSFPVGLCSTFKFMNKDPPTDPQVYDCI